MTMKIKLTIVATAALAFISGGLYIKALRADNVRLALNLAVAQAEAAGYKIELTINRQALFDREKQLAEINMATELLKNQLEALYELDEEAKSWGDAYLPKSIIDKLR